MTSVTSISPPYPQESHKFVEGTCINNLLTEFIDQSVCLVLKGKERTEEHPFYGGTTSPDGYITYICRIKAVKPNDKMFEVTVSDVQVVAADYLTSYCTMIHGIKEEYHFDDDIYYMYIKNRTIDLRKYDVFPGDCYITLNAKVLPTREPMFYPVPPELSPENLKIRHAQMLASLEAEDQVYGPVHKIRNFITYNMNCKINCIYSPKTSVNK